MPGPHPLASLVLLASFNLLADQRRDWLPATVVGLGLAALGGWFLRSHLRSFRSHAEDASLPAVELEHYRRQFRRRVQASGLLLLIGVLVPVGDWVIPWGPGRAGMIGWSCYWIGVLGLTLWVLLLGMGDLAATSAHSRSAMSRLQQKQRELEAEAQRLRARAQTGRESELDP